MDILLAEERAKHEYVKSLQSHREVPFKDVLKAFEEYRTLVQECAFTDFFQAERLEKRLWQQHIETRQLLARTLKDLRKTKEKVVEIRIAVEMYARFIRHSVRFYRAYVYKLSTYFGIPELQAIASQIKREEVMDVVPNMIATELQELVLISCYRSLIYLGDLCRYRASDALDEKPTYGPAIGFYSLASAVRPSDGQSYHQQAIVAVEQSDHVRAICNFYRSFLIAEPVAIGRSNLAKQYARADTAWENGELIGRSPSGGPASQEKAMLGWFIRLHSMCVTGHHFKGYKEILRELFTRLKAELQQSSLGPKLRRMVFVNMGAQHTAVEKYTEVQSTNNEQAFYYTMHINIVFFTTLLELLHAELVLIAKQQRLVDADLPDKVTPGMTRVLPALRLYSVWLLHNIHLVQGLSNNAFLESSVERFWRSYAQVLDIIAALFPIWDLEDVEPASHLLEEDVEALGFLPLDDDNVKNSPVYKTWYNTATGARKPRLNGTEPLPLNNVEEMLNRILSFLEVGSFLAENVENTPLFIRGTRFTFGVDAATFLLPRPPTPPPVEPPKPLSYAAAAAKAQRQRQNTRSSPGVLQDNSNINTSTMTDTMHEDDDPDHPITPPQSNIVNATFIEATMDDHHLDMPPLPKDTISLPMSPSTTLIPDTVLSSNRRSFGRNRLVEDLSDFSPRPKPGENAMIWSPSDKHSGPASSTPKVHQRGGSATSIRSTASPRLYDSWSSHDSAFEDKRAKGRQLDNGITMTGTLQQGLASSGQTISEPRSNDRKASPLLFGGSSIWTSTPKAITRPESDG